MTDAAAPLRQEAAGAEIGDVLTSIRRMIAHEEERPAPAGVLRLDASAAVPVDARETARPTLVSAAVPSFIAPPAASQPAPDQPRSAALEEARAAALRWAMAAAQAAGAAPDFASLAAAAEREGVLTAFPPRPAQGAAPDGDAQADGTAQSRLDAAAAGADPSRPVAAVGREASPALSGAAAPAPDAGDMLGPAGGAPFSASPAPDAAWRTAPDQGLRAFGVAPGGAAADRALGPAWPGTDPARPRGEAPDAVQGRGAKADAPGGTSPAAFPNPAAPRFGGSTPYPQTAAPTASDILFHPETPMTLHSLSPAALPAESETSFLATLIRDVLRQELTSDPNGRTARELRTVILQEVARAISGDAGRVRG